MSDRPPSCPLCAAPARGTTFPFGTVWNGSTFEYVRCSDCGSSFLDPLPGEEDFRRMYRQSEYHQFFYEEVPEEAESRLWEAKRYLEPRKTLLDFGCGNGAFLIEATKAGFACEGVELDTTTREQASRNSGCRVRPIEEVQASGDRFDIIHLGDVLEHLPQPLETMTDLSKLLSDDGVMFLEGPLEDNAGLVFYASAAFGRLKKMLGRPSLGTYPPYHLFRASAVSQRRFFERRLGWQVLHYSVYETGWPYISDPRQPGERLAIGAAVRSAIGRAAIGAARTGALVGASLGNRFSAVVAPPR